MTASTLGTFAGAALPGPDAGSAADPPWPGRNLSIPAGAAQREATRHPRGVGKVLGGGGTQGPEKGHWEERRANRGRGARDE